MTTGCAGCAGGQGPEYGGFGRGRLSGRPADRRHDPVELKSTSSIRAIANVVQVEATSFDVLIDRGCRVGLGHRGRDDHRNATPQIERISIPLHELSAMPKASQRLLDDSAFDVEGWLAGRIADKFARARRRPSSMATVVDKPRGFLTHDKVANASWAWGIWAMSRRVLRVILPRPMRRMRWSIWSMRWMPATGPMRVS
jgi:hypothetical protein